MTDRITVPGRGSVEAPPDLATMGFGVSVLRPTVEEALAAATVSAEALNRALADHGIARNDVQTAQYAIAPEYDFSGNKRRMVGYRVTNTVTANVRDLDTIGVVIAAAAEAAGDQVQMNGLAFLVEDDAHYRSVAREAAWRDAAGRAGELAGLAGRTLGQALEISESASFRPPTPVMRASAMAAEAAPPPIEAGTTTVTADLTVVFGLE
jgi:uncharacterized protein